VNSAEQKLVVVWETLRVGLGVGAFLAGLDKFFNLLTAWSMYLSPLVLRIVPMSANVFMRGVGIVEMAVGIAILTRFTRLGAYVMAAWLLAISLNLATTGNFWDLAVRDVEIALSAFALARLTEWRATLPAEEAKSTPPGHLLNRHAKA